MLPHRLAVILVRPKVSANVGAVCRLIKNFGLGPLRLVQPETLKESRIRAVAHGALDIWEAHTRYEDLDTACGDAHWVVGATRRSGRLRPLHFNPANYAERMVQRSQEELGALVFGPEESGLAAEEIERCHALVEIEQASHQPSLNLSHAVGILGYHLHIASMANVDEKPEGSERSVRGATQHERALVVDRMMRHMECAGYPQERRERLERAFRVFFNRPFIEEPDIRVFQQWLASWELWLDQVPDEE